MSNNEARQSRTHAFNACLNDADGKHSHGRMVAVPLPINPVKRRLELDTYIPEGVANSSGLLITNNCSDCHDCMELRVLSKDYPVTKKTRDLMKRNQDLYFETGPAIPDYDLYRLHKQYYEDRFPDNKESTWGPTDFELFMRQHDTMMTLRDVNDALVCVMLCNHLKNGIIGVSLFYDTDEDVMKRSPGKYAFMRLFQYAAENGLDHVYIGTWNRHSEIYAYKADFKNLETYAGVKRGWVPFDRNKNLEGPTNAHKILPLKLNL